MCLDPRYMQTNSEEAIKKSKELLEKLVSLKHRITDDCDNIIRKYKTLLGEIERHSKCLSCSCMWEVNIDTMCCGR